MVPDMMSNSVARPEPKHNAAVNGTKLPRSRRIAAKARCHEGTGAWQLKGMGIGL